jgi:hypothetical protein
MVSQSDTIEGVRDMEIREDLFKKLPRSLCEEQENERASSRSG